MDELKPINEAENLRRVEAGWTGGPYFGKMNAPAPMTIVEGVQPGVKEMLATGGAVPTGKPLDPWVYRK